MQADLVSRGSDTKILGVNEFGVATHTSFVEDRDLAWLQDTDTTNVWDSWAVNYRDVVVVDAQGAPLDVFNLSDADLRDQAEYDRLIDALVAAEEG